MPELPEVETIVRDIRPALLGRTLGRVSLSHDDILRGVSRRRLLRDLPGSTVQSVFRRAKHAVLDFGERRLVVQPGMTGSLIVYDRPLEPDQARYAVLRARLDDGRPWRGRSPPRTAPRSRRCCRRRPDGPGP